MQSRSAQPSASSAAVGASSAHAKADDPDAADARARSARSGGIGPGRGDRERFLTFALTAAELLLEISPGNRIEFAAGTFNHRFGSPAEAWVGRSADAIVTVGDRAAFGTALSLLRARDRLPPTAFRLADAAMTPASVAGLRVPRADGARLCLTVSALPAPPGAAPGVVGAAALRDAAEESLRGAEHKGCLALLELRGPDGPLTPRPELRARIDATLADAAGGDGIPGEIAAGRYGLLSASAAGLVEVAARIEAVLSQAGLSGTVAASSLDLSEPGLSPMQATRALRFALSAFSRGGTAALHEAGFADGLGGFVADACNRAAAIRRVIAERRFRLSFQPIVALADRRVCHYEALLRPLPTPGCPIDLAQEFVSFAEAVGLSEELDWAVVDAACGAARRASGARIACNLSGLSLQMPAFRDRLLTALRAEPELVPRLLIEITETAEIEDEAEAVTTVEALRALGLPLCLDDFGAGAAAFQYLRMLRVDYVKIDGLYVRNALRSEQDRGFVAAMVDLAHTVGAAVVAERIETEAEAAAMRALGVGYGQGWLFGRPGALPGSL